MGKPYAAPVMLEYGRIDQLTLGQRGTLPDYNQDGTHFVNDNCSDPIETDKGKSANSPPFGCGAAIGS